MGEGGVPLFALYLILLRLGTWGGGQNDMLRDWGRNLRFLGRMLYGPSWRYFLIEVMWWPREWGKEESPCLHYKPSLLKYRTWEVGDARWYASWVRKEIRIPRPYVIGPSLFAFRKWNDWYVLVNEERRCLLVCMTNHHCWNLVHEGGAKWQASWVRKEFKNSPAICYWPIMNGTS